MGPRPRGVGTPSPGPGPGASARWRGEREAGWGASSGDNSARECACREGAPRARPPGARAGRGRDCGRKSQELSPGAPVPTRAAWREPGREGPEEGVGTGKGTPRSGPCRRGSPGLAGGEAGALAGAHSRALSAAPGIAAPGRGRGAASPARSRAPPQGHRDMDSGTAARGSGGTPGPARGRPLPRMARGRARRPSGPRPGRALGGRVGGAVRASPAPPCRPRRFRSTCARRAAGTRRLGSTSPVSPASYPPTARGGVSSPLLGPAIARVGPSASPLPPGETEAQRCGSPWDHTRAGRWPNRV